MGRYECATIMQTKKENSGLPKNQGLCSFEVKPGMDRLNM